jgi:hypothetical protein
MKIPEDLHVFSDSEMDGSRYSVGPEEIVLLTYLPSVNGGSWVPIDGPVIYQTLFFRRYTC